MQARVSWSTIGRCALTSMAASTLVFLGGCSSGVSRFDFPSFNLARNNDAPLADPNTTASLPVPQESVYASGGTSDNQGSQLARSPLPPPQPYPSQSYAPRVTPAAYSPAPNLKPQPTAYVPSPALRPKPAMPRAGAEPSPAWSATAAPGADKTYKVQKGDTPHLIAEKLGVSEKALVERNQLEPSRLHIGQVLQIPNGASGSGKSPTPTVAANAGRPASPSPRAAPDIHVVKTTAIPAPGTPSQSHAGAPAAEPVKPAPAIADSSDVTGPSHGQNAQVASVDQLPAPEPMSGNSFRWPVQGRIVSEFGTKPDGGHNDGIDVAVPQGTSVKAAENGVVAYAGDELKGYGNLVLIRHSNNWVSAYAHNEEILVKRGDQVRRGQIIAKAGKTGQVSQPQVHFELRKGSRPVDPTKFMTNAQASAD
jgi:murein DD-endopeptidase MepM/ murein hydrolase activator NlpD